MHPEIDASDSQMEQFLRSVLALRDAQECRAFFDTILTAAEAERLPARWRIARMLAERSGTSKEIAVEVGVSTTTVSSVNARLRRTHAALEVIVNRLGSREGCRS